MEFLIEFVLEILFEGSMELSTNKKIPKWIRYIFMVLIILLFLTVTIGLIVLGLLFINKEPLALFFIIIGTVLLILSIIKIKKLYFEKETKNK